MPTSKARYTSHSQKAVPQLKNNVLSRNLRLVLLKFNTAFCISLEQTNNLSKMKKNMQILHLMPPSLKKICL